MNLTNARNIVIDGKAVQQISIDGKIVYASGPIIRLTADKSFILAPETVTITVTCEELPYTEIKLYSVINMTKTLLDTLETDENGQATYTYEGTGAGSISFVAEYDGDSSNTVTVDDYTPAVTDISLIANTYSFNYGGSVTLTATVKDQHNQAISGETVTFKNGSTSLGTGTTDSNGAATLIKSDLDAGTYNITAEISTVSSTAITVNVNKLNTSLTLDTPLIVYSDAFSVTGELTDSNGNGIVGATVTLQWNDGTAHTDTATTVTGGEVTFSRDAPTAITQYSFKLVYESTTNYNATESSQVNVTAEKETSVLNVTSPTSGTSITGSTFSVAGTLKDNDNTAMASKDVLVKLGTTLLDTLTTDSNGAFSGNVDSSGLSDGSNTLDFVFAEETYYTSATQQVTVSKTSYDGMSMSKTAGKQILSYADSGATPETEYCTVTAQLTNSGSSASVSDVPVVFGAYLNDVLITGSEQSVDTDSNGQASYTYTTQGLGDVVVKAVPDSRTSLIQTYEVYDYYAYQASGSHTFSSSTMTYYQLYDLNSIGDCEISVKLKSANTKGFALEYRKDNTVDNNNRVRIGVGGDNKLLASVISNSVEDLNYEGSNYSANSDLNCKIVHENNSIKATITNSTYTMRDISDLRYVGINNWNNAKTVSWTDFKVKPL